MPLHLLGKKSWNVYNADNVARVQRDEAAAKAAEEAEEQRMQEVDAQRRLAILRREVPPPLEDKGDEEPSRIENTPNDVPAAFQGGPRKKRKRYGEDDTDYELRIAKERTDAAYTNLETVRKPTSSAPIVDRAGHIDLLGDNRARAHAEKNDEAEAEARKKKKEYEDQYTMRFSNAAGKSGTHKPWYSQSDGVAPDSSSKDTWGNDDPTRKDRDSRRIISNDPLAMMKKGSSQIRELKKERRKLQEDRDEELRQLRKERHHGRHRDRDRGDEGERLDSRRRGSGARHSRERSRDRYNDRHDHKERRRHKEERRHRRRHGSRSRSRSPARQSHHDRYSKEK